MLKVRKEKKRKEEKEDDGLLILKIVSGSWEKDAISWNSIYSLGKIKWNEMKKEEEEEEKEDEAYTTRKFGVSHSIQYAVVCIYRS